MTPNVILAGDLNIFRINDIDGRFFSYVINHKANKDISRIAQGKSIVHIKGEEISKIQIKYPSDEEQQKILSFIELLSLKIEKQERLIDKLKKYKRGLLSALFPKKGEITPQYRFAGFTEPWEQRKLG
ncbi:MAG TPA: restriction endonuclease subunit S, partial [Ruminococcus sp.]|nr:restriction endonuclease subunit S [Ruminococcus sp.]